MTTRRVFCTALCGVIVIVQAISGNAFAQCGKERWAIKDLNDREATEINFTPLTRRVEQLLALPMVKPRSSDSRRPPELRVYRVRCEIVKYKLEDDGDIHLVIQDPDDPSMHMVAEIPSPACPDAIAGGHAAEYKAARDAMYALFADHPPAKRMKAVVPPRFVEITGPGFYDFPHHQTGAAPNNLEIHPVLSLKTVQ